MDCKQHATFRTKSGTLPPNPPPILVTKVTCFCMEPCQACPPPEKASWFFFGPVPQPALNSSWFFSARYLGTPKISSWFFFARYLKALFLEPGFFLARYLPKGWFPSYFGTWFFHARYLEGRREDPEGECKTRAVLCIFGLPTPHPHTPPPPTHPSPTPHPPAPTRQA